MKRQPSFLYRNSLTLVFLLLFLICIGFQAYFGWQEYNEELVENSLSPIGAIDYLQTGHFVSATFENWESEFLQMGLFVIFTIFLRQQGSSESKALSGKEAVDKEPRSSSKAPWPVKKGGWVLSLYKNSLSICLLLFFALSFFVHLYGSWRDFNAEALMKHKSLISIGKYLSNSRFWFESFQNYQSEFLSIAAIIFLSIYLRQKGSPQSKPVDMPFYETE